MKVLLISMPDVTPVFVHESAFHMPNLGIASIGANIGKQHDVFIIDLIRKRRQVKNYITKKINQIQPGLVGLSAMSWQFGTCVKLIKLVKILLPNTKIAIGGYHATLMYQEITKSPASKWIDFIIRGEGETAFAQLVNALENNHNLSNIYSLSFKIGGKFFHNPQGELIDLATLERPIRDRRRLNSGYHLMHSKIEVMETSRGCNRACKFCCIHHMYGKSFRTFPIKRVMDDIDDIYYNKKTRWIFIVDDNIVLNSKWVMRLCDAVIQKKYPGLKLAVQADCISISKNEKMVHQMARAGFKAVFLGIESISKENLKTIQKGDIVEAAKKAVEICHKYGITVIGGLVFGFPDDDEKAIIENFKYLKSLDADAAYLQILTPYPKTQLREELIKLDLVTNLDQFEYYNGLWANIKTKYLDSNKLQYLFWYHRQKILGWWTPSHQGGRNRELWTIVWEYIVKPMMKIFIGKKQRKIGWEGRYHEEIQRLKNMNVFKDLDGD